MSTAEQVQSSVGRGVAFTVARHAIVIPVSLVASVVLARLLTPDEFGAFTIAMVLVMGLGSLFEMGLMSVLIQQASSPSLREQRTVFTFYLALFGTLAIAMWFAAPFLAVWFRLPTDGVDLLHWMTPHLLFGAFGCVSLARLEREMRFGVLSVTDIVGVLLDKGLSILLAWGGFGVWSFVWASLAATSLRILAVFMAAPWRMGLAFDRALVTSYLSRGAYFQGINLASLARDNLLTFVGSTLLGTRAVGLLNWAQNLPGMVTNNANSIYQRVFFPAFARLAEKPAAREDLLWQSLRTFLLSVIPLMVILPSLGDGLVNFVYGASWKDALPVLWLFALRMGASAISGPLMTYLNARGEARSSWYWLKRATCIEWTVALLLVHFFGLWGVAIGVASGAVFMAIGLAAELNQRHPIPLLRVAGPAILLSMVLYALASSGAAWVTSLPRLIGLLLFLALAWLAGVTWFERERLREAWNRRRVEGFQWPKGA